MQQTLEKIGKQVFYKRYSKNDTRIMSGHLFCLILKRLKMERLKHQKKFYNCSARLEMP